jgi:hypothetical protein
VGLRTGLLLIALSLSACAEPPPAKRAADAVASIRSWTATVRLATESWLRDKTPVAYTVTTLLKAEGMLGDERKVLEAGPVSPEVARSGALLRAPEASARRLAVAVARGDRPAARRELAALRGVEAGLRALDARLSAAEAR